MDFIVSHLDAIFTFVLTAGSFLGVMYAKFNVVGTRLDKLEIRVETLEDDIEDSKNKIDRVETNLVARLDRIENKIDNFIQNRVQ